VIKKRAEALRILSSSKKRAYFERFLDREVLVLIQEKRKDGNLKGLSRNYLSVSISGHTAPVNTEVTVRITGIDKDQLIGVAVR
jgi:tRNA A37 methylthiotransferase MiaB